MKKTLIVVDMQNDFIDGALGTGEAVAIVDNVKAKIENYRKSGDEIIFTRDTHGENYLETSEGKKLPVEHCIKGAYGWEIAEGLCEEGDTIIDKPSFGWTGWGDYNFDEIEIVGLCTDICVVSNALILKATFPDVPITVDARCCAGVNPATHKAALETMKMCQINVEGE
ncbi:MAG: cysteine hydrolase [Ruminococcaceae bacterium]|nr:cysteine hydrolase [Oscillospiraceae bacterium]